MSEYCGLFGSEMFDEGRCNRDVLEEVYDKDKDIYHDGFMRQLFRRARRGVLCYANGPQVMNIRGACDAMQLACRGPPFIQQSPPRIDSCWSIRAAQQNPPPAGPAVTNRPNPPVPGPPGWYGWGM
nr:uncharacterized protein LOC129272318 [Lytechinus pictus]